MLIQPKFLSLSDLLSNRLFRIPQYQRSYSWERKHREDMFDDIRSLADQSDRRHFMATVVGLGRGRRTIVTDEYAVIEVVDGQQRITTLIILLKAIQLALDENAADQTKLAKELQGVLIKQDELSLILLQMNHDPNGYFAEYLRNGSICAPDRATTLADRALLNAIRECTAFVKSWNDLILLTSIVKNRLTFIFHEIDDEATVYSVFEVLNSRGLSVPWLDRLKSLLMGIAFKYGSGNQVDTIEELHTIWEGIYRTIGLRQGLNTEALRFAATLRASNLRSRFFGEEDSVESLVAQCENNPVRAVETSRWLLKVSNAVEDFLSVAHRSKAITRIAHARLLAVSIGLSGLNEESKKKLLATWERISFRVFGLCRKDARTQVGAYVRLSWDLINTVVTESSIEECLLAIGSEDREHSIDWAVESITNTNCYEGWEEELRYLMYRYEEDHASSPLTNEQWHRIWEESASHSIEHIQAQQTQSRYIHRLGNLMLLPPGMNSSLNDRKPFGKVSAYRSTGLFAANEVADMIEAHGSWSQAQVDERERKITAWVRKTWA